MKLYILLIVLNSAIILFEILYSINSFKFCNLVDSVCRNGKDNLHSTAANSDPPTIKFDSKLMEPIPKSTSNIVIVKRQINFFSDSANIGISGEKSNTLVSPMIEDDEVLESGAGQLQDNQKTSNEKKRTQENSEDRPKTSKEAGFEITEDLSSDECSRYG